MKNSEIRIKALAKAKDHNFSAAGAFTYFLMGLVLLAGDITGIPAADVAIYAVIAFAVSLICGPGYVHVAMETWRQGKKNFSGLFYGFRNIKKAAAPAVVLSPESDRNTCASWASMARRMASSGSRASMRNLKSCRAS